jgi:hypothetical protein
MAKEQKSDMRRQVPYNKKKKEGRALKNSENYLMEEMDYTVTPLTGRDSFILQKN